MSSESKPQKFAGVRRVREQALQHIGELANLQKDRESREGSGISPEAATSIILSEKFIVFAANAVLQNIPAVLRAAKKATKDKAPTMDPDLAKLVLQAVNIPTKDPVLDSLCQALADDLDEIETSA
ncbi:MAG: hypothetical protein GF390_01390 [Candidatus Pacebacteria bacterium]|nr:hypothetical protein [Candidatus Paceibacterota bacterium]